MAINIDKKFVVIGVVIIVVLAFVFLSITNKNKKAEVIESTSTEVVENI